MKLQLGKQYKTRCGVLTGPLVNNPERSINYPFKDPYTGIEYTEDGESWTGCHNDEIKHVEYTVEEMTDNDMRNHIKSTYLYQNLEQENDEMKAYIKEVVLMMQKLRATHVKSWNELPQSVKDYIAE